MLPHIKITNLVDGEIVNHSFVIVHGKIHVLSSKHTLINFCKEQILVWTKCDSVPSSWPIINSKFKAVIQLNIGTNNINFQFGEIKREISILYHPVDCSAIVKLVYIKCYDSDGSFQAPASQKNDIKAAKQKISLAANLVQAVMAEKMRDHGLKRKCFKLEENDGKVVCHVFTSKLKLEDIHAMNSEELWVHFATELMSSSLSNEAPCKFLAFLSGTIYLCESQEPPLNHAEVLANTKGHVALGGGGLALFGTGCLHTWASNLKELAFCLSDDTQVDRMKFMDDSCNRGVNWACYSSGLGATLHELGHAFDLGHSKKGIMGLGFHEFRRELIETSRDSCCVCLNKTVQSPTYNLSWNFQINPSKFSTDNWPSPKEKCLKCSDGSYWIRSQALMLFHHKWMTTETSLQSIITFPTFKANKIEWFSGIRLIEIRNLTGMWLHHLEYTDKDVKQLDLKLLIQALPPLDPIVSFVIMDRVGNIHKVDVNAMTHSAVLN